MTDNIVTRLRDWAVDLYPAPYGACMEQAADEIERLREIIQDIANAITDEGIKPGYHRQQVNYLRTMWNPLWQAIGKAVKEVRGD